MDQGCGESSVLQTLGLLTPPREFPPCLVHRGISFHARKRLFLRLKAHHGRSNGLCNKGPGVNFIRTFLQYRRRMGVNFFTLMVGWIFDNYLEVKDILMLSRFGTPFDME